MVAEPFPYGAKKRPRLGRCWSSLPSSLRLCRLRCSSSSSRSLAGVNRHQDDLIDYLREENRVLREHLGPRPLRLTDAQRRRLAVARSQTRPAGLDAGRGHRHPGYDPALVPETDRQEIRWQRPPTSRSTNDPTRRRRARGQDGGRQSAVGLHADPRRALKPRPHYRPDHGASGSCTTTESTRRPSGAGTCPGRRSCRRTGRAWRPAICSPSRC